LSAETDLVKTTCDEVV